MKYLLSFLLLSIFAFSAQSQIKNTLTIYSEAEEPFTLIVNGQQMSEDYVTRLEFETFDNYYQKAIIKFKNKEIADITNKYIHVSGDGTPTATVYKIYKKEKKKKGQIVTLYKLGYVSSSGKNSPTQTVIIQNAEKKEQDGITIKKGNTKVIIGQ